jgi:hypothetical protein
VDLIVTLGQGQLYLRFASVGKAQTPTAGTSVSQTDSRPGSLHATGLLNLALDGRNFADVCLHAGNVEFSTPCEVRMSMRVTKCINLFDYFPIHQEQLQ